VDGQPRSARCGPGSPAATCIGDRRSIRSEVGDVRGVDRFAPHIVGGILIAPEDSRIRSSRGRVTLDADVRGIDAASSAWESGRRGPTVPKRIAVPLACILESAGIVRAGRALMETNSAGRLSGYELRAARLDRSLKGYTPKRNRPWNRWEGICRRHWSHRGVDTDPREA